MKDMSWYVVEVAFSQHNVIHRAIVFHRSRGVVEFYGHYEESIRKSIKDLPYFHIIEELTEMNGRRGKGNLGKTPAMLAEEKQADAHLH